MERKGDNKKLITTVGEISFKKTLYKSKYECDENGKPIQCYLLDKVLGLIPYQTMTEDAVANILDEAVQTSYRKGGEAASKDGVSKGAVKDLIHDLKFPANYKKPASKKEADYLYIEADEDHYHLQFQQIKGDLERNENGRKLNGAINKLIYVHEGIKPEAPKSKRHRLVDPHYFCRGSCQDNRDLWEEVFSYIEDTYDTTNIKRIYLSSDGGGWIKTGYRGLANITFVLDEYHLSKYIAKLTDHMKDSADDAKRELYDCIRNKNNGCFQIQNQRQQCSHPLAGLPLTGSAGNATLLFLTEADKYKAVPIIVTVGEVLRAFPAGSVKGGGGRRWRSELI